MAGPRHTGIYVLWIILVTAIGVTVLVMLCAVALGLIAILLPQQWPEHLQTHSVASGFSISLPTATSYGRAIFCGKFLIQGTMVGLVLLPLAGIVHTVIRRQPFVRANVTRLRIFSGAFGLIVALRLIGPLLFPFWYMLMLEEPPSPRVDYYALSVALLGLTLAQVFLEGLRLRVDAEGTI